MICLLVIIRIHNEIICHFSVSSKCVEVLNEPFHFLEMEGDSLLETCAFRMTITGAGHRQDAIILTFIKSYFQSMEQEKCLFLNFIYMTDDNGEKYYNMTHLYVFPKLFDELWRSYRESGKRYSILFYLSCVNFCVGWGKKKLKEKHCLFLGFKIAYKKKKKISPEKSSYVK